LEIAQRLGLVFNYFLMALLALLFFLFLTNTGILGMMGLKTVSFSMARNLIRETLTSSTGS
jgi:lipopolysaccharide export LptBFGC system permease protein LptF